MSVLNIRCFAPEVLMLLEKIYRGEDLTSFPILDPNVDTITLDDTGDIFYEFINKPSTAILNNRNWAAATVDCAWRIQRMDESLGDDVRKSVLLIDDDTKVVGIEGRELIINDVKGNSHHLIASISEMFSITIVVFVIDVIDGEEHMTIIEYDKGQVVYFMPATKAKNLVS